MGTIILAAYFFIYATIIIHIILAIKTSKLLLRNIELANLYYCLFVVWFIPVFGSLAVTKKENLKKEV